MPDDESIDAPSRADLVVVGGGILGLAVAAEAIRAHPGISLCVLEREGRLAAHQSSHNSGVIHAGIYYPPGSAKARLCVEGAAAMYRYCGERGIPHERCGKLIVARHPAELAGLAELERRGRANGVEGLRRLDAAEIAEIEPHAAGIAALHSPTTGIVDFAEVARALAGEVTDAGGRILTGCEVRRASPARGARGGVQVRHRAGVITARCAIFCAGVFSDRLAVASGASPDPRIVPFRGAYLRLRPEHGHLVRGLIYPVPDPSLPFLGVHLTRTIHGDVLIGPTALIAGARDAYRLRRVRAADVLDTVSWPGSWRMLSRWWRASLTELRHAVDRRALVRAAAAYLPDLRNVAPEPAFAGIRAQALRRDGGLEDDFVFSETPMVLHVRNAPSPAATSALAIAREVVGRAERSLGLGE